MISFDYRTEYLKKHTLSSDAVFNRFTVCNKNAVLVFYKEIVDVEKTGNLLLKPLKNLTGKITEKNILSNILTPDYKTTLDINEVLQNISNGSVALIIDGIKNIFTFDFKKYAERSITEPPTSTVIKGPREGFVESISVNMGLMRKKLKTSDLRFINLTVGEISKTQVCVCYINKIADKKLIKKVVKRIKDIKTDAILDSSYISKFLGEHKTSFFKQVGNTEKPDILSAKILEGRVAIFVDGSPIALTLPYLLLEDFQSPSDYYSSPYNATMARGVRVLSVLISILLPSFFVSAELFHLQLIPLSFLLTIVNGIKGIPLSPSSEMFFTLMIFEILNEASVRMPKYVGMVVSIVGGLVLGETAVNAGIISAPTLMIVALSGICLYTVPELEKTFSLIRIIFLIVAGSFGGIGLIGCMAGLIIYLVSFENYSTPLLAPFAPLIKEDLKDGIVKGFMLNHTHRPKSLRNKNKVRIENK